MVSDGRQDVFDGNMKKFRRNWADRDNSTSRIGEKFIDWSDSREPLSLNTILALTTFYWFTRTLPRSIYPYRQFGAWVSDRASRIDDTTHAKATLESTEKPFGFAAFPCELATPPQTMVQRIFPSLVTYKMHQVVGYVSFIGFLFRGKIIIKLMDFP